MKNLLILITLLLSFNALSCEIALHSYSADDDIVYDLQGNTYNNEEVRELGTKCEIKWTFMETNYEKDFCNPSKNTCPWQIGV